ncbi:PHP-associated domain-containing protein [Isosphaeraceae bacterium EP7]
MAKFDHHLHTSRHSPDSIIDPNVLAVRGRAAGLDGLVITEHDHQWSAEELEEINAGLVDFVILSGVEVSAFEGHFLVYGLPDLTDVRPGMRVRELLKVVRRRGAAIVAAHPYRWDQDFDSIVAENGASFDGIEMVSNNVTPQTRAKAERLLSRLPMGRTGSSDAHQAEVVGCYHTEFPGTIRTMADFVTAVRSGKGIPRHAGGDLMAAGPLD